MGIVFALCNRNSQTNPLCAICQCVYAEELSFCLFTVSYCRKSVCACASSGFATVAAMSLLNVCMCTNTSLEVITSTCCRHVIFSNESYTGIN